MCTSENPLAMSLQTEHHDSFLAIAYLFYFYYSAYSVSLRLNCLLIPLQTHCCSSSRLREDDIDRALLFHNDDAIPQGSTVDFMGRAGDRGPLIPAGRTLVD